MNKKGFMKLHELIKLIWRYLESSKKMVWFCIFLATFSSTISAFIPLVYGRLVDEAIKPQADLILISFILLAWLIFVSLANWMNRFINLKGGELGGKTYQGFVADVYSHYLQLPLAFHKEKKSGEQLSKIDRAADHLWSLISEVTFYLIPGFFTAVIALVLMYLSEWRLASVMVVILAFYSLATVVKTKPIIKAQKIINRFWEKTWGHIYDTVHNIEVVKSHVKEREEKTNIDRYLSQTIDKMVWFFKKWRDLSAWQDNIQGLGFVVTFGLALYLLSYGQISAGVLVTFVGYVNLVFRPFNQLANNYRLVQRGLTTINRAVKLFNIQPELYEQGKKLKEIKGRLEFKNVSFAYGEKHKKVLLHINFIVEPGEVTAVVGESGTGKTTLLSLISRYYHLNAGKILLDGVDVKDINLTFLRQQMALVPQEVSLFNDTVKKNLIYAKKSASEEEIITALTAANAWQFVNKFPKKLNQVVGERGIKLSTGQKQRIAIARAILREPKILILDEATSALDSVSEKLVQEALKELIKGRTTFIIAHRLSTVTHADKILVFDKGRLVEQGKHEELIKLNGVYSRLYQKQKF